MEFMQAKSAREALEALLKARGQAVLLAGGTDLMVNIQEGKAHPQVMIDINTAADMKGIRLEGEELVIGAAATLSEIDQDPLVVKYFPSLAKAASTVGSLQIRNLATLTGNVMTAQPAADGAMALAPLEPRFAVLSEEGERLVPMAQMYAGFGKTALDQSKELVKEIRIPLPHLGEAAAFTRLELRKSLSLPMLNTAAMLKMEQGVIAWARITMGPVGVGPVRATEAEAFLQGKPLTRENAAEAGRLALKNAKPRSNPLRGSKEYREEVLPVLVRRTLEDIGAQLGVL